MLGATWALTGAVNPYKAARATFNAEPGYPVGEGDVRALPPVSTLRASSRPLLVLTPLFEPVRRLRRALLSCRPPHRSLDLPPRGGAPGGARPLAATTRRRSRRSPASLGLALFYLVWMPANFFGGETFLGNRYILSAYPCLLVALSRLPSRRVLLAHLGNGGDRGSVGRARSP